MVIGGVGSVHGPHPLLMTLTAKQQNTLVIPSKFLSNGGGGGRVGKIPGCPLPLCETLHDLPEIEDELSAYYMSIVEPHQVSFEWC